MEATHRASVRQGAGRLDHDRRRVHLGGASGGGRHVTFHGRALPRGLPPTAGLRVLDSRVTINVALAVKPPTAGYVKREGQYLTRDEIEDPAEACTEEYADVVRVLALAGLRWGELAGLKVGDRVRVPAEGLRLQRSDIVEPGQGGAVRGHAEEQAVAHVPSRGRPGAGGRQVVGRQVRRGLAVPRPEQWPVERAELEQVGWLGRGDPKDHRPTLRVHDLRHTCASLWLGAGADPKVVQRILGHASAAMTMDLYGHLIDHNLWSAAKRVGGILGASEPGEEPGQEGGRSGEGL